MDLSETPGTRNGSDLRGPDQALEALAPLLGDRVRVLEPDGMPGSAFALVRGAGGTYWYVCDLLSLKRHALRSRGCESAAHFLRRLFRADHNPEDATSRGDTHRRRGDRCLGGC